MNNQYKSNVYGLLGFILLCIFVELGGGWMTSLSVHTWYPTLAKPSWTPPPWVFGPVWTYLYLTMAIAGWLIWKEVHNNNRSKLPLWLFGIQLGLNFIWSGLFFSLQNPFLGMIDICLLLLTLIITTVVFWDINKIAGLLMVPYLIWVSYATSLNIAIWILNKG